MEGAVGIGQTARLGTGEIATVYLGTATSGRITQSECKTDEVTMPWNNSLE